MWSSQGTCSEKQLGTNPGMAHSQGHQAPSPQFTSPFPQGAWNLELSVQAFCPPEGRVWAPQDEICQSKPTEVRNFSEKPAEEKAVCRSHWSSPIIAISARRSHLTVLTALSKISIFESLSVVLGFATLRLQSRHCKHQGPASPQRSCPSPLQRRLPRGEGKWLKRLLTAWKLRTLIVLFKILCLDFFLH